MNKILVLLGEKYTRLILIMIAKATKNDILIKIAPILPAF